MKKNLVSNLHSVDRATFLKFARLGFVVNRALAFCAAYVLRTETVQFIAW